MHLGSLTHIPLTIVSVIDDKKDLARFCIPDNDVTIESDPEKHKIVAIRGNEAINGYTKGIQRHRGWRR